MPEDLARNDELWVRILGPVYDRVIEGADVCLAGLDELLIENVTVIVRESAGAPGWVGVVEADLMPYREFKLELRLEGKNVPCGVMFTVGGEVFGRTLIRGTGPMPGDTPKARSRPRVTPMPRELRPE